MRITTANSSEVLSLETQLEKLENRAEEIAADIKSARADVADVQRRFIADTASHADLIAAEQSAAALESAASVLNTQIAAQETALERQHKIEARQKKRVEAEQLAATIERERQATFERASLVLEAITTDLPQVVAHMRNTAQTSKRLSNLLASDNAPKFEGADARRMNDLATEDAVSVRAQIYRQSADNEAAQTFRDLLEKLVNGFSVAPPAPAAAPADLSDINRLASVNVEFRGMLQNRLTSQLDGMIEARESA